MQSEKATSNTSQIVHGVEAATKLIIVLGLAALTTAFLYDFVFWTSIDRRVLTFLVTADHIQTAVYALAIIMLTVGGIIFCTWLFSVISRKFEKALTAINSRWGNKVYWILEFGAAALSILALNYEGNVFVNILVCVAWLSIIFRRLFVSDIELWRRAIVVLIAWFVTAGLIAYFDALSVTRASTANDIVTVDTGKSPVWSYEIRGRLLRLAERGAIIKSSDGRIVFVPKDHLLRIDQSVPSGT